MVYRKAFTFNDKNSKIIDIKVNEDQDIDEDDSDLIDQDKQIVFNPSNNEIDLIDSSSNQMKQSYGYICPKPNLYYMIKAADKQ